MSDFEIDEDLTYQYYHCLYYNFNTQWGSKKDKIMRLLTKVLMSWYQQIDDNIISLLLSMDFSIEMQIVQGKLGLHDWQFLTESFQVTITKISKPW